VIVVLVGRRQLDKELGAADVRVTVQRLVQVLGHCKTTTLAVFRSLRVQSVLIKVTFSSALRKRFAENSDSEITYSVSMQWLCTGGNNYKEVWRFFAMETALPVMCNRWTFLWSPYNRADHYIFIMWFSLLLFLLSFFSPNLSRRRLDVCHTSTHGVTLVRI